MKVRAKVTAVPSSDIGTLLPGNHICEEPASSKPCAGIADKGASDQPRYSEGLGVGRPFLQ